MKLANIRRIAREEMTDAPAWIDKLLVPLNQALEQLTQAVSGQLSYGDNVFCSTQTNNFTNGVELVTKNPLPQGTKPYGIHVFTTDNIVGVDGYRLVQKASGELGITIWFKGSNADVFLTRNAVQVITTATDTPVDWTTSQRLDGAFSWSSATNPSRITVTSAGVYEFSFTVAYAASAVGFRTGWLSKNGVITGTASRFGDIKFNTGADNWVASGSSIIAMEPNDFVELYTHQTSGGNLNLLGNAAEEAQIVGHSLDVKNKYSSTVNYVIVGG